MSFGRILSRGFEAANHTPVAILLYIGILGLQQAMSVVMQGLVPPESYAFDFDPQQGLPREFLLMMSFGCFSCIWGIVMVFGLPWVMGGAVGQIRDRIVDPQGPVGPFRHYGSRFYARILLLFLLMIGLVVLCYIPLWIFGMARAFGEMQHGPIPPERIQELSRDPTMMLLSVPYVLVITAIGTVFNLAWAALVAENETTLRSLRRSLAFCRARFAPVALLYLVYVGLSVPMVGLYAVAPLLEIRDVGLLAAIGIVAGFYVPYIAVLNLGFATSLYLGRRPDGGQALARGEEHPAGPSA